EEINVQIVQAIKIDKLDFHRVCLQSELPLKGNFFFMQRTRQVSCIGHTLVCTAKLLFKKLCHLPMWNIT
ncbi:hypothetical protein ACFX4I_26035, partial [Peribacillus sp. YIM B13472]|uniref:hypothetical protein n=1 Tax=Peribacillus sp. YIM B13472 TaxID=3366297 RepID=UPI00366C772D